MKTVSTLCATSTVGIAVVGYSLGRSQGRVTGTPSTHKRKAVLDEAEYGYTPNVSALTTADPPSSPVAPNPSSPQPSPIELPITARVKRKTSVGWDGLKRLSDLRLEGGSISDHDQIGSEPKGSTTSGKAWLKRLSKVSTSQTPSPTSSPGPDSPSITFSSGSAAPILHSSPIGTQTAPSPNKLVKRSASHHTSLRMVSAPLSGKNSKVPGLRRPATSHQRSATMQHQLDFVGMGALPAQETPQVDPPAQFGGQEPASAMADTITDWRHYFEPRASKLTKDDPQMKRSTITSRPANSAIRRIVPNPRHHPTLLKPSAITSFFDDDDALSQISLNQDDDPFIFGSRPATPSGLDELFASPGEKGELSEARNVERERSPRRSFSIGDMFGTSNSWMPRSRNSRSSKQGRISLSTGKRYSSAPLTAMPPRASVSGHAGRGSPRTDITDPAIFARESHASHPNQTPNHPSTQGPRIGLPQPRSDPIVRSHRTSSYQHMLPPRPLSSARTNRVSGPTSSPTPRTGSRNQRLSLAAPSDRASTLVDSDNEFRASPLAGEEDLDFQSDTVFDSLRTGATGSSSGIRGPRLETMFDDSPPQKMSKERHELIHSVPQAESVDPTHDIPEENESMSTPRRIPTHFRDDEYMTPVRRPHVATVESDAASASPNSLDSRPKLNLGQLQWDVHDAEKEPHRWSLDADDDDDEDWSRNDVVGSATNVLSSPPSGHRIHSGRPDTKTAPALSIANENSPNISHQHGPEDGHRSILDWSEAHDGFSSKENFPLSRAAQEKQASDHRDSRSSGRRGPSAPHVRSQSVPVIPDPSAQRERGAATARYGTWGLGSKGVSEDWNEDFDFDGFDGEQADDGAKGEGDRLNADSRMVVPAAIKERQASVIGHLGHVKEFALLVEDLKRLRSLAAAKRIIHGSSAELWKEAEGIIDLATLDDDNQELPPPRSPSSSQGFGFDPFEEEATALSANGRNRRKSVLSLEDDIFGAGTNASSNVESTTEGWSQTSTPSSARASHKGDRQNTSAVARSVVETMHQRRSSSDPLLSTFNTNPENKMPFDTTTLRDLVAHVSVLTRRLAEIVRNAESLSSSPSQSPKPSPTPSLGQVLAESATSSPSLGKPRQPRSKNNHGVNSGQLKGKENEMSGQLPMMTVV